MTGLVFGDDLLHLTDDGHIVVAEAESVEFLFVGEGLLVRILADGSDLDLRMDGRTRLLGIVEDLLVELLAIAESGELDLDITRSGKIDHTLCKVGNANGLAHIEDEDLASLAHGTGFEHQLAGLGDEHEVADDIGVRDGDRTATTNLLAEDRDDRTIAAQDVAKTGGDELTGRPTPGPSLMEGSNYLRGRKGWNVSLRLGTLNCLILRLGTWSFLLLLQGSVEGLAVDLADALGTTHDVGGVDGLVGRDHDELAGAVTNGKVGNDTRAVDVVLDRHGGVVLHHRHVLVGSGVEDVLGTMLAEDLLHVGRIADGAYDGPARDIGMMAGHIEADVVHRRLGLVDEDKFGRSELSDLANHLAADTAGSTGDEDALATQHGTDGIEVDLNLVARQKVLDVDLVELLMTKLGMTVPRLGRRHHHDLDASLGEEGDELVMLAELLGTRRRYEEHTGAETIHVTDELGIGRIDVGTHQEAALHLGFVAHEALDQIAERMLTAHRLGDSNTTLANAVNEDTFSVLGLVATVEQILDKNAHTPHENHGGEEGHDEAAKRNGMREIDSTQAQQPYTKARKAITYDESTADTKQIGERRIAQNAAVGMEKAHAYEEDRQGA